jgi:hypothetical protein
MKKHILYLPLNLSPVHVACPSQSIGIKFAERLIYLKQFLRKLVNLETLESQ